MVSIIWNEGPYKFTDPIRYFKANDPYYFEVDNIPLKQLQENIIWVKDQLSRFEITGFNRSPFDELRPYVGGTNNTVKVRPGRYTARVNDAYDLQGVSTATSHARQLQVLSAFLGSDLGEIDHWNASTQTLAGIVQDVLQKMVASCDAANATFMTGLDERTFTHPVITAYAAANGDWIGTSPGYPTIKGEGGKLEGMNKPPFPLSEVLLWASTSSNKTTYAVKSFDIKNKHLGFLPLATAENHMIKRWRGVFRTAIVDVPNELSIDIPQFDEDDYFYIDSKGLRKSMSANVRIDLLFIYTKSIDADSAYIGKWVNGAPTRITRATLGIVKGAGLGLDFTKLSNVGAQYEPKAGVTTDGTPMILANPSDECATEAGFTELGIHGSFPSPDDLLNKAPTLAEELEGTDYRLVGQSILPVAYVVVRREASKNEGGKHVIPIADIIDIRPLFRTTELAYNERAGIAAALPALSLANPAVGKAHMDYELERIHTDYSTKIEVVDKKIKPPTEPYAGPRAVACGYIFGGANWGVESTIMDELGSSYKTAAEQKAALITRYNLPSETVVPDRPDWDVSRWVSEGNFGAAGAYPNDYVNTLVGNPINDGRKEDHGIGGGNGKPQKYGCFDNAALTHRARGFGTDNYKGYDNNYHIHFVKKTIAIDRTKVKNWMQDYTVDVTLWNCFPLSNRAGGIYKAGPAGSSSIWVTKEVDKFTIYCAWVANDAGPYFHAKHDGKNAVPGSKGLGKFWPALQRSGHWFAGFGVMTQEMYRARPAAESFIGESAVGVAIYPTVMFKVTGIPSTYKVYTELGSSNSIEFQ